jgi:RecA-family ATPase
MEMSGNKIENYHTYALRQLSAQDRIDFIEYCLYDKLEGKEVGVVIIDGIADLCSDVNNIEESNLVVQKLMKWTKELHCHIITVIHSNFGTDKPTGHLGSALEKKAETQIQLELNTVNKELVTVSCKRSRNTSFESFSFKVNKAGLPQVEGNLYDVLKGVF